jgi:acyl dehydratase
MNLDKVLGKDFPAIEHPLVPRDCMLFALGVGVGSRADATADLQFCYEEGLKIFPAMVNVIAHPGAWVKEPQLGIDWVKILHGEQSFAIFKSLQPGKIYVGNYRVLNVIDKGAGKGALLYLEKQLREQGGEEVVSTVTSTYVLRGDGGCGGTTVEAPAVHAIPERTPDLSLSLPTLPQAGLIYRLSGDYNPIHADPAIARKAGFERPILHGLCTMGVAVRALLQACCGHQPELLQFMSLRFSAPVYPGETIVTDFWRDGAVVSFRARVAERNVVVLNNGRAELRE